MKSLKGTQTLFHRRRRILKAFEQNTLDDSLCSSRTGPGLATSLSDRHQKFSGEQNRASTAAKGMTFLFCSSKYSTAESNYSSHMKGRKLHSGSNIAKLHYNKLAA